MKDWNASGVTYDYQIAVVTRHDHGNSAPWADFERRTIVGGRDHELELEHVRARGFVDLTQNLPAAAERPFP